MVNIVKLNRVNKGEFEELTQVNKGTNYLAVKQELDKNRIQHHDKIVLTTHRTVCTHQLRSILAPIVAVSHPVIRNQILFESHQMIGEGECRT